MINLIKNRKISAMIFLTGIVGVALLLVLMKPQKRVRAFESSAPGDCFENIGGPSSIPRTDAPWSTFNVPVSEVRWEEAPREFLPERYHVDINGDGLVDYIYDDSYIYKKYSTDPLQYDIYRCVMLNNGTGWDVVFSCEVHGTATTLEYYGDCAGQSGYEALLNCENHPQPLSVGDFNTIKIKNIV